MNTFAKIIHTPPVLPDGLKVRLSSSVHRKLKPEYGSGHQRDGNFRYILFTHPIAKPCHDSDNMITS
jgi:hypothetical protein